MWILLFTSSGWLRMSLWAWPKRRSVNVIGIWSKMEQAVTQSPNLSMVCSSSVMYFLALPRIPLIFALLSVYAGDQTAIALDWNSNARRCNLCNSDNIVWVSARVFRESCVFIFESCVDCAGSWRVNNSIADFRGTNNSIIWSISLCASLTWRSKGSTPQKYFYSSRYVASIPGLHPWGIWSKCRTYSSILER
jgi:hypothetical protein